MFKLVKEGFVNPSIKAPLTFFQQDIQKLLQESVLGLVPLGEGSGIKIKLLDMAIAGLPVVTTSIGVRGLENIGFISCDDDFKIANIVCDLLENSLKRKHIGVNCRRNVLMKHSLAEMVKGLLEVYEFVLKQEHASWSILSPMELSSVKKYKKIIAPWMLEGRIHNSSSNICSMLKI